MTKGVKKNFKRAATGLAFFLSLLALSLAALPYVIESQAVKDKLTKEILNQVGADFKYRDINFTLFPSPRLLAQDVSFLIPDKLDVSTASMSVTPELLPILSGKFQIHQFSLDSPEVKIHLSDDPDAPEKKGETKASSLIETLKTAIQSVAIIGKNPAIKVVKGRITLLEKETTLITVQDIDLTYEKNQKVLDFSLESKSSLYGKLDGKFNIDPRSLDIDGSLTIVDAGIPKLLTLFAPLDQFEVSKGDLGMTIQFNSQALKTFQAGLKGNISGLNIRRINKDAEIGNLDFLADVLYENDSLKIDLNKFHVDQPALDFSGNASKTPGPDPASPGSYHVELTGKNIDIKPVRHMAVTLASDIPIIPVIFNILKEGQIKQVVLKSSSDSINKIATYENLTINSQLEGVKINLPGSDPGFKNMSADIQVAGDELNFQKFTGSFGSSRFSDLTGRLEWSDKFLVHAASGKADLSLEELFLWANSFETLKKDLTPLKSINGKLKISDLSFKGPVDDFSKTEYRFKSDLDNLTIATDLLPDKLKVSSGALDLSSKDIVFKDLAARILDSSILATGEFKDFPADNRQLNVKIAGDIGVKTAMWGLEKADLSQTLQIKAPIAVQKIELTSDLKKTITIAGTLKPADGPEIIADLQVKPDEIMISKLSLKDAHTDALISFKKQAHDIDAAFKGRLDMQTFNTFLSDKFISSGRVDGDMKASLPMNQWQDMKITGKMTGENIEIFIPDSDKLALKQFSISSSDHSIKIDSADIQWGEDAVSINGTAQKKANALLFEMNADAQSLDVEKLLAKIDTQSSQDSQDSIAESGKDPKKIMLNGSINLNIDHLEYKHYNLTPLKAEIVLKENQTIVNLLESKLCSIAVPGSVIVTPGKIKLHMTPTASNNEFKPALQCLTQNKRYIMDGIFNLDGDLSAEGNPESLVESLNGPINLKLLNGRIYQDVTLSRILALVNMTEIFLGQNPDFQKEGFPYNEIDLKATFENGVLNLNHYTFDSPTLEAICRGKIDFPKGTMDMIVLVAPLKTVNRVVNTIPILRDVLSGTMFTFPIKIQGPIDNPEITPLSPSAVGEDLLNAMGEVLKTPVKIFQPLTDKP